MAELRSVDPRTLEPNPNNPRRIAAPASMDDQLLASIQAIGLIQPPIAREVDGRLIISAGHRRVAAAIRADMASIDVLISAGDDTTVSMEALSENLVRAAMSNVDIWRAIETLERQGWNEQAIADALALPLRTVKRLKLLARLHPPMLDVMGKGSMPSEQDLRVIAASALEDQAQVWKKHKPKKGEEFNWYRIAHALSKRRIPFSAAKFDDALAHAYGVVWEDDLFAPADEDGRYTTNVDGFMGAQQEWLQNNLPERGTLLPQNDYGQPLLPKKAERIYTKPAKGDIVGHCVNPQTGTVETVAYRMPVETKAGKKGGVVEAGISTASPVTTRADVTQMGECIIGQLRTQALHEALIGTPLPDQTLIALLVLALAGRNVSVFSPNHLLTGGERERLAGRLADGGTITSDDDLIRNTAREMLALVLSCIPNASNSGITALIAGDAIGAAANLPTMATDEFLSCLSRQALERAASEAGVPVKVRVKDTRAALVERFEAERYVYPAALFTVTEAQLREANRTTDRHWAAGIGHTDVANNRTGDADAGGGEDLSAGQGPDAALAEHEPLAIAAE